MMRGAAGIAVVLAALTVTSWADNNYYASCASDPGVGVINMRPGKVKGHTVASPSNIRQCHIGCTRQLSPVCGNDGTTYGNECAMCAAACRDHSLYLACHGDCPCPAVTEQDRGDPMAARDGDDLAAVLPENLQQEQRGEPRRQAASAQDNLAPKIKAGPRKLKKNPNPVIVITDIDLNIAAGDITADALNQLTLDLHADMAPESNPVSQSSLWVVELYFKGKGKTPKQGVVHQALNPIQSEATLDVGQPLVIRGVQYDLDLRGMACADVAKVCAHLRHQKTGNRRAKVIGKPSKKVLRSCTKVTCQAATQ